jgi:L-ascorbate metabolism protein UlaG (beta-lactamase superfamily)
MPTRIRFFGVAAYELTLPTGEHVLVDPFLDGNSASPVKSTDLPRVDLILVTDAAFNRMGDTRAIALRTGAPVVCGVEVKAYLAAKGIPDEQVRAISWGSAVDVAEARIRSVEARGVSQILLPNGTLASGVPMGFVVETEPGVRFYHYGGTSLFGDLKLIAELYRPTVGCVAAANPAEILSDTTGAGRLTSAGMTPHEGAMAAAWLKLHTVLPCHYLKPDDDEHLKEFNYHLGQMRWRGERVPQSVTLKPGDEFTAERVPDEK